MFKKERSEGQASKGLDESVPKAGATQKSEPGSVGNKMMLIGVVPLVAFLLFVLLGVVGMSSPIIGIVLLLAGAGGFFFMWKQASGALNSSLEALRDEAYAVANEDLPRVGHAISTGTPIAEIANSRQTASFSDPAFASVAGGLNAVRDSAGGIGGSVANLQKGISDTYVNLARRNQALVDRQLEAIDTLEAEERDADKLALLYRVDHLATRMHRNAESLLVLADAKTPERHSPPVALREVLRVAIGEVEDYRRIVPISLDEISVAGPKAQNMAHLLAELMENSAQHSPPGTSVDVTGAVDPRTGDYMITILDHGTGMAADQLAELNELLAKPPTSTLTISHSIGLQVVSRLAAGLGITVRLNHGQDGGITTLVFISAAVVAAWGQGAPAASAGQGSAPVAPAPVAPAPVAPAPIAPAPVASATEAPSLFPTVGIDSHETASPSPFKMPAPTPVADPAPVADVAPVADPAPLADVAPVADPAPAQPEPVIFEPGNSTFEPGNSTFETSKDDIFSDVAPSPLVPEPTAPAVDDLKPETAPTTSIGASPAVEAPAPEPAAAPTATPATAMSSPAAASETAQASAPTSSPSATKLTKRRRSAPGSTPAANLDEIRTAPSQRSPDQVKSMLSRYKSGLERGRGPAETDGES